MTLTPTGTQTYKSKYFQDRADALSTRIKHISQEIARIEYQVRGSKNVYAENRIAGLSARRETLIRDRHKALCNAGRL